MDVIDRARVIDIFGDDTAGARELLQLAADSAGSIVDRIVALSASSHPQALTLALHELRGAAANVGAADVADHATRLETIAHGEGCTTLSAARQTELRDALSRLNAGIEAF